MKLNKAPKYKKHCTGIFLWFSSSTITLLVCTGSIQLPLKSVHSSGPFWVLEGFYLKINPGYGYWEYAVFIFTVCLLTTIHSFTGLNCNSQHLLNSLYTIYSLCHSLIHLVPCFSLEERLKQTTKKHWNTKTGVLRHLYCNNYFLRAINNFKLKGDVR